MPRSRLAIICALVIAAGSCSDAATTTSSASACGPSSPMASGALTDDRLNEVSGLVIGRSDPDVIWVHNDSGDGPVLYALDAAGKTLASLTLTGVDARDWEDIAIGPGADEDHSYLYIGDIGDNQAIRSRITVYRVVEPHIAQEEDPILEGAEAIHLAYPDGPRDAETLLVDPATGALIIVSKSLSGQAGVYRADAAPGPAVTTMERIATLQLGLGQPATGGDISADRDRVAVRTYTSIRIWGISPDQAVEDAIAGEACRVAVGVEEQGEAVGFAADGTLATISEGLGSLVYRYDDPLGSGR